MNVHQLECFIEVAKSLNFTEAARRLYLAQPSVSYQIAQLEKELGFPLLERSIKDVQLTAAGKVFYRGAKELLGELADLTAEAKRAYTLSKQNIVIAHHSYVHDPLFLEALHGFSCVYPEINCSVRLPITEPDGNVSLRNADVFIRPLSRRGCECIGALNESSRTLYSTRLYGLLSCDHSLSERNFLKMEDIKDFCGLLYSKKVLDIVDAWYCDEIRKNPEDYRIEYLSTRTFEEAYLHLRDGESILFSLGIHVNLPPWLRQIPFSGGLPISTIIRKGDDCHKAAANRFIDFFIDYYSTHWPETLRFEYWGAAPTN